ncbi:MAG TPA: class I SAM-dependent methyltransferase [Roseiflexaceae bacterium]|nr:class I SAM-dependent methyltransferase [Roseiflexaceae bacterium]HMP39787.1 class I SAM-dependent methyltransferase [Roseiflexaceae bacterium]
MPAGQHDLAALHQGLDPLLDTLLATLPHVDSALDIGSGSGLKHPVLATIASQIISLDTDHGALVAAPRPALVADAHALPIGSARLDFACMIATLGLLAAPQAALCEVARVLRPTGMILIVSATRQYVEIIHWPDELAALLTPLVATHSISAHADIVGPLHEQLLTAGMMPTTQRAFLHERAGTPAQRELPLVPWAHLQPLAARHLGHDQLAACAMHAIPEIELQTIVIGMCAVRSMG